MPYRRAIVQIKSSLAPNGKSLLYDLDSVLGFVWAGTSELTADEILNPQIERKAPARENAEEFLLELLTDGKMKQKDISAEAENCGISEITLRRAREKLGIICRRGKGNDKDWYWSLPQLAHTETHEQVEQDEQVTNKDVHVAHVDHVKMNEQVTNQGNFVEIESMDDLPTANLVELPTDEL